ncbi:MAG: hypothetical protein ACE366_25920 [Bradymonadia bacterium]
MSVAIHGSGIWGVTERLGAWLGRQGTVPVEATDGIFDATGSTAEESTHAEADAQGASTQSRREAPRLPRRPRVRAGTPAPMYSARGQIVFQEGQTVGGRLDVAA